MNILKKFELDGHNALITGGANGLGKVMATGLASAGCNVIIADAAEETAQATAAEIAKLTGRKTMGIHMDITSIDEVNATVEKMAAEFGTIDVLLNNAGIWRCEEAEKMSWANWYDVINVNLNGTFIVSQAVGRQMIKQRKGSIISISSVSGEIINDPPYKCSYNASKAGVMMLTKALAAEWARYNIRVNSISPGCMKYEEHKDTDWIKAEKWLYPMDRWGYSEELCGMLVYLASDASSFVTGQVYNVDGGFTLWKGKEPFPEV